MAATVDQAVAAALLNALTPEQVALALSAADQVTDRYQRVSRAAQLAVERARYDANRAERAFHQVEPENRLVARTLEAPFQAVEFGGAGPGRLWVMPRACRCSRTRSARGVCRSSKKVSARVREWRAASCWPACCWALPRL